MKLFYFKKVFESGGYKRTVWASFNVERVLYTVPYQDGCIVTIDDGHEESIKKERRDSKGRTEEYKEREWHQAQIPLDKEDTDRLMMVASVDGWHDPVAPVKLATAKLPDPITDDLQVNDNEVQLGGTLDVETELEEMGEALGNNKP